MLGDPNLLHLMEKVVDPDTSCAECMQAVVSTLLYPYRSTIVKNSTQTHYVLDLSDLVSKSQFCTFDTKQPMKYVLSLCKQIFKIHFMI